jgi:hypothetical protein
MLCQQRGIVRKLYFKIVPVQPDISNPILRLAGYDDQEIAYEAAKLGYVKN